MAHEVFAARLKRIETQVAQLRIDIESWNANRHDAEPFDIGSLLVAERLIADMWVALDRDDCETFSELNSRLLEVLDDPG